MMQFARYYILDEKNDPVPVDDALVWAKWFEVNSDKRILQQDFFDWQGSKIMVSTVFLSLPHPTLIPGKMTLYESMIFADKAILEKFVSLSESESRSIIGLFVDEPDIQKRYETKDEAIKGHKALCDFVDVVIQKQLL